MPLVENYFTFVPSLDSLNPLHGPPVKNLWTRAGMSNAKDRAGRILCFSTQKAVCGPTLKKFQYFLKYFDQFFMTISL